MSDEFYPFPDEGQADVPHRWSEDGSGGVFCAVCRHAYGFAEPCPGPDDDTEPADDR